MGQEAEERAVNGAAEDGGKAGPSDSAPSESQNGQANPRRPMRISSPEQVDDYIRVTTPGMWLLVVAMLVLLCALLIWGFTMKIEMKTTDQNGQVTTEYVTPASFLTDKSTGS